MSSSAATLPRRQTEITIRDGYKRLKDVYIPMRDGAVLCSNIYLPIVDSHETAKFPAIISIGPYGKDIHFPDFGMPHTDMYANMAKAITPMGPDACFETPDPSTWAKEFGYAVVRIDTRGSGGSPGKLDAFGLNRTIEIDGDAEGQDAYDAIEWVATQPWSNEKVAMSGISYLAMIQYWAAMQHPPHLKAIVPYEGLTDMYAHSTRQGGVFHTGFQKHWFNNIIIPQQHGRLEGLDEIELTQNRFDFTSMETKWVWRSEGPWPVLDRARALQKIEVPILSAGNWIDAEIHLPGNLAAFEESSSEWKFLEMHTGNHLYDYYEKSQVERQRKFLDYFLFDKKDNGLDKAPRIELLIRRGTDNFYRTESSWPPKDAQHTSLYFTPEKKLSFDAYKPSSEDDALTYPGLTGFSEFETDPFKEPFEILGYPYLELTVSTDAKDMDIFAYFYVVNSQGEKIVFKGGHDEPAISFVRTWFRLSHRTLSDKSTDHHPILDQQSPASVKANEFYTVKIPVPPTSIIIEKGQKLAVALRADDEEAVIPPMRHVGEDRSEGVFGGTNRIVYGGRLVVPVVKRG